MTTPVLALELLYLIIDQVLESELQHYQHVFAPSTSSTAFELLATSHTFQNYLKQQDRFHRLRLWRLLNRIPRQFEPIQVAVGTMTSFTVLSIDMSTEKITNIPHVATTVISDHANMTETFLVLQETSSSIRSYRAQDESLVYAKKPRTTNGWAYGGGGGGNLTTATAAAATTTTSGCSGGFLKGKKTKKDTRMKTIEGMDASGMDGSNNNNNNSNNGDDDDNINGDDGTHFNSSKDASTRITLSLFPLATFLRHIQWYALHHDASVWLWKRSTRFFKGDNLDLLLQQQFRYILDTPRHALIAWDRPYQHNYRFTENVLNSNVELFSKLLPSF